jgi:putative DNA primase/helicase
LPPLRVSWLTPRFNQIPQRLISRAHWVVWSAIWNGAKWTKEPFNPNGYRASTTRSETWVSFESVRSAYEMFLESPMPWSGVGYVLNADDDLVGVDLDHVVDASGRVAPWASGVIRRCNSYSEVSPSGAGIRIFVAGRLPGSGLKRAGVGEDGKGSIEIYDRARFLTVTGHQLEGFPKCIECRQGVLDGIVAEFFADASGKSFSTREAGLTERSFVETITDEAVVEIACASKNGDRFCALFFDGNLADYDGDWSRADLALVRTLLFYTGGNIAQTERLFTSSALCRTKWADRPDYRERTIKAALANQTKFYDPNWPSNSRRNLP